MYLKCLGTVTLFVHVLASSAHGAACLVPADSLANAKAQYLASCTLPLKDCDPVGGKWYCSSEKISTGSIASALQTNTQHAQPAQPTALSSGQTSLSQVSVAPPLEAGSCIDTDGDGWGWDGVRSCTIAARSSSIGFQSTELPIASYQQTPDTCLDPDGDGWGWDGLKSCRITTATTPVPVRAERLVSQNSATCGGPYTPSDITDLVLVTGQSNVTGAETSVSASLDRWGNVIEFHNPDKSHPRVFAWTVDARNNNAGTGWRVAALNQSWHDGAPGIGGIARNSFAFHFAKKVVEHDACKVVGFVVVSEGGKGISHWDNNAQGWREVIRHVTEAMSAINRTFIDGILWHQGESDWIIDGTCFTGTVCRNHQPDYYPQKLYSRIADQAIPNPIGNSALIDRLRRQSWFSADKPFIAGETIKAPVNAHLNKLNTDNDSFTSCISSNLESGLGVRENDPFKNHYSASGLRELGARYATEYLRMTK